MARFDVYRRSDGQLLVDVQADLLDNLTSRVVVPLVQSLAGERITLRLHPEFEFQGERLTLATHLLSAVRTKALGDRVGSLAERQYEIANAVDMLFSGF